MPDNLQVADSTAITSQRQPYSDVTNIPEVQLEGREAPSQNPLVPAMETLTQFVQGQEQKGNPAAGEMKQHLAAFMQAALKSGAPGQEPPEEKQYDSTPIFDATKPPPEEAAGPAPMAGNQNTSVQPLV